MIKASIIGATGYAGLELTRILSLHPEVKIVGAVSRMAAGKHLSEVYPSFKGKDLVLLSELNDSDDSDVVFTALPHGVSMNIVPSLIAKGKKVIDLSADFRYDDADTYKKWYLEHKCKDLLEDAVYGLCEINKDKIRTAKLIGNPGCYTTCSILPLYPLLKEGLISTDNIIIDAKSGTSGAGRKESLGFSFCEVNENFKAYSVAVHRHTSEIEEKLSWAANKNIALSFTPHLLPVKRGILATIYANIENISRKDVLDAYKMYSSEPFINVYENGLPELKHVNGSNNVNIGFVIDERLNRLVIVSCIDNLIKGAAGQAVQNMNLMYGLDETTGLSPVAWYL
ncbi:MAG: N-acetyl-gamma-glutamyl-phosphate reductase [Eubacteriales bacterium]